MNSLLDKINNKTSQKDINIEQIERRDSNDLFDQNIDYDQSKPANVQNQKQIEHTLQKFKKNKKDNSNIPTKFSPHPRYPLYQWYLNPLTSISDIPLIEQNTTELIPDNYYIKFNKLILLK